MGESTPQPPKNPGKPGTMAAMIAKTYFLAKIIHRIGAQNLRGKKCLPKNPA
jgi:hypothetical protein